MDDLRLAHKHIGYALMRVRWGRQCFERAGFRRPSNLPDEIKREPLTDSEALLEWIQATQKVLVELKPVADLAYPDNHPILGRWYGLTYSSGWNSFNWKAAPLIWNADSRYSVVEKAFAGCNQCAARLGHEFGMSHHSLAMQHCVDFLSPFWQASWLADREDNPHLYDTPNAQHRSMSRSMETWGERLSQSSGEGWTPTVLALGELLRRKRRDGGESVFDMAVASETYLAIDRLEYNRLGVELDREALLATELKASTPSSPFTVDVARRTLTVGQVTKEWKSPTLLQLLVRFQSRDRLGVDEAIDAVGRQVKEATVKGYASKLTNELLVLFPNFPFEFTYRDGVILRQPTQRKV